MRTLALSAVAALAVACGSTPAADAPEVASPTAILIDVGGYQFDGLAAGPEDGELVLLLHGFPQTSFSYRNQLPVLARAGYRAVAVDQRGYSPGARPAAVRDYAMPYLVEDVVGIADALGRERFHVVGHDWGAAVAWFTAMCHPDRVLTVTALSVPHPRAFVQAMANPAGEQAQRSSYMQRFMEEGSEADFLADDAAMLRSVYSENLDESEIDRYVDVLGTPEALRAALNWYRAMSSTVPYATMTAIRMPAMYVWSTEDTTMSREGAELTANFVEGPYRFEVLEGIGHWIPEDAAERVNELLLEHLGQRVTKRAPPAGG